ncbi:hypothetical protein ACFFWC_00820 [Plantactinospora siamensis]|uniref:Uncharacterized protein n=1 Tax=Plantactinospora siamensis TaxID=555372 RepID=A0ABV6NTI7_9ACTN
MTRPEVVVGQVVHIPEPDYRYGTGELILRVSIVGPIEQLADGAWLELTGIELRQDGSIRRPQPRQALVRLSALRRATGTR